MEAIRLKMASKTPSADLAACSVDDFLGGAVRLIQPLDGYRVSMDTVLLAACVHAKAGERVLEAGVGTAGAALCLARRIEGVFVDGVDIQPQMIHYARMNIQFNDLDARVAVREADVRTLTGQAGTYDHILINPPYLAQGKAIRPPDSNKGQAHMDENAVLKDWVRYSLYHAKHKASISLIYRADRLDELIASLYGRVGDLRILPLWSREGKPAKRVIVQGRKGTHGACVMLPGLTVHGAAERYTDNVRRILWDGEALALA